MLNPAVDAADYDVVVDSPDAAPKHGTSVQAGWGAVKALSKSKGDYPTDFKLSDRTQLIRFLDDEPFIVYQQHWIDRTEGKRSFVCLEDGCPLCAWGDRPRVKVALNVLVLSNGEPTVQILTAGSLLSSQLAEIHNDTRLGPLSKYCRAITRYGTGPSTSYSVERVLDPELAAEWELDPETVEAAVKSAEKYGPDSVYVSPRSELETLARSLPKQ